MEKGQFIAILGEPYEIKGTYKEDDIHATFRWCDESGDHLLVLSYAATPDYQEVNGMSYRNLAD